MKKHNLFKGLFTCLLALVLVAGTFAAGVKAETTTVAKPTAVAGTQYDPAKDTISNSSATIIYVLKKEKDNTIKAGSACIEADANADLSLTEDLGVKGTTKDVYLYVCDKEFEEDGKSISANMVIKAQAAKKVTGTVNYTKADSATADDVLGATATDANKKAIAAENITVIWSAEKDGAYAASTTFTGAKLKEMLEAGGTIYIKMLGVSGGSGTAVRTSQAYKIKVAKQGKAPSVKIDVKKNTISLKNGMDYANATKDGETYTVGSWMTVLPYLKDTKNVTEIVPIANYKPGDKKVDADKNAVVTVTVTPGENAGDPSTITYDGTASFTKTKVKEITVAGLDGGSIAVRTSATDKKPASAVAYYDISEVAKAPQIYTVENASNCEIIGEEASFSFKTPVIVNYVSKWTDDIGEDVAPANDATKDEATAKYEMAVIKKADLGNIDWSTVSWKAIKEGTKITDKVKTKYALYGKTASDVTLKAGAATAADSDIYLVIRRAGVKGKTVNDTVLASDLLITRVYKDGKTFVWTIVTQTGQVLVGGEGVACTVKVNTWNATSKAYAEDTTKAITKWVKKGGALEIELPEVDGSVYFDNAETPAVVTKVSFASSDTASDAEKTVTLKAKATVKIGDTEITKNSSDKAIYVGDADVVLTVTVPTGKVLKDGTGYTKASDTTIQIDSITAATTTITLTLEDAPTE